MISKDIILSTSCFPPVSYIISMLEAENIIIDIGENYKKQSYRTRYEIYTASGKYALSIPVSRPGGNHTPVRDILISDHEPWQRTHFRTIQAAYQNSPYYIHYIDEVEAILFNSGTLLYKFNDYCLNGIMDLLGITVSYKYSSAYIQDSRESEDFRNRITPKTDNHLTGVLKINSYHQVFEDTRGYIADLSVLDLLFNLGPEALLYMNSIRKNLL